MMNAQLLLTFTSKIDFLRFTQKKAVPTANGYRLYAGVCITIKQKQATANGENAS